MVGSFAKAGLAALIALGSFAGVTSAAQASDFGLGIYVGGAPGGYGWHGGPGGRPDRWDERRGPRRDSCAPWMAEEKASRMGLRRARVVDMTPRRVVVAGIDRGGRDRIVFANEHGCPVIRR